jgi:hypothetical protein
LIKRLAATAGDRITINAVGVEVNGVSLANSKPCVADAAGRPLQPCALKDQLKLVTFTKAGFHNLQIYFGGSLAGGAALLTLLYGYHLGFIQAGVTYRTIVVGLLISLGVQFLTVLVSS